MELKPAYLDPQPFRVPSERSAAETVAVLARELKRAGTYYTDDGEWNVRLLRGHAGSDGVLIYERSGQDSFRPEFSGAVVSRPDGGSELVGTIGPGWAARFGYWMLTAFGGGLFGLVGLIGVVAETAHGHLLKALPFLAPLAGALVWTVMLRWISKLATRASAAQGVFLEEWLRRQLTAR